MTRASSLLLVGVLVAAAGCTGTVPKAGAEFHAPGPLALFTGVVAHESGSIRAYLAIGNERGGELRLVDTTDNEVVTSPGIVYPLSIPTLGRPKFVVAANLNDGGRPDALVVLSEGSSVVELVDTWSGQPAVVKELDLGAGLQVLSVAAAPRPDGAGGVTVGVARILVGLAGGRLAVVEATRPAPGVDAIDLALVTVAPHLDLGFDPLSLTQAGAPGFFLYAATGDPLPGAVHGVARIDLPSSLAGWDKATATHGLDARAPTEKVAVVRVDLWNPATDAFDGGAVDRVVAVLSSAGCGEGKPIRCGIVAVDVNPITGAGGIAPKPAVVPPLPDADAWLQPVQVPGLVVALVAAGRAASALMPVASVAGVVSTTGVAVAASSDGRLYPLDVARWALVSNTSPVTGAGKTRVTGATPVAGTGSAIGLWSLDGATLSATASDLPARVRVTPGYTPDDSFTLEWQGILPSLGSRAAVLGRDSTGPWLGIQVGSGAALLSFAELGTLGIAAGDLVELAAGGSCAAEELVVSGPIDVTVADAPGGALRFATAPCLTPIPVGGAVATVATVRAPELVLFGAASGLLGRPAVDLAPPAGPIAETDFAGTRLFYVTDSCPAASECEATWKTGPYALTFPYPTGPRLGLAPGFVDVAGLPTTAAPSRGTALRFTTASGRSASVRQPIISGGPAGSTIPDGLLLADPGLPDVGPEIFASYTSGLVTRASLATSPSTMTVYK